MSTTNLTHEQRMQLEKAEAARSLAPVNGSPSTELLRNVGVQLVRTKLGKCGKCGCETQFNANPVGKRRHRTNLCAACYQAKMVRDAMVVIRTSMNQLAHMSRVMRELNSNALSEPITAFGLALNNALKNLENEKL